MTLMPVMMCFLFCSKKMVHYMTDPKATSVSRTQLNQVAESFRGFYVLHRSHKILPLTGSRALFSKPYMKFKVPCVYVSESSQLAAATFEFQ